MKITKVTRQKITKKRCKDSDRAPSIAVPSPELKSFSRNFSDPRHARGFQSENLVEQYFQARGFEIRGRRIRTPFAEVDLLLWSSDEGWHVVEVKSVREHWDEMILSPQQLGRLKKSVEYLRLRVGEQPILLLAAVNQLGRIEVLPLD